MENRKVRQCFKEDCVHCRSTLYDLKTRINGLEKTNLNLTSQLEIERKSHEKTLEVLKAFFLKEKP